MPISRYGPTRTYIARRNGEERTLEVHYSNGHVETLRPIGHPAYGDQFLWDYSGSGPMGTAGAILSHALGEVPDDDDYNERVRPLLIDFVAAFFGDAHHDDVRDGFDLPAEIVLAWVFKNEGRILDRTRDRRRHSARDAARSVAMDDFSWAMQPDPHTLEQILGQTPV